MSIFDSPADKAFKRFDDVLARFDVERERASQMSHRAWAREKFLAATSDLANDETDEDALEAVVESAPTGEMPYTTEEFMAHTVCIHALTKRFARLTQPPPTYGK